MPSAPTPPSAPTTDSLRTSRASVAKDTKTEFRDGDLLSLTPIQIQYFFVFFASFCLSFPSSVFTALLALSALSALSSLCANVDLCLYAVGRHFEREIEGVDGLVELKRPVNQRFQVDFA